MDIRAFYEKNKTAINYALISFPLALGISFFIIAIGIFTILQINPFSDTIIFDLTLIFGGLIISVCLGILINKLLSKIQNERNSRLARTIILAVIGLLDLLVIFILFISPILRAYGLI
jgi:hypothetical protein